MTVEFEDICAAEDGLLDYAVIVSRYEGQWVFCKHRQRDTWEVPGGRREPDEFILDTAHRELFEETGAAKYDLSPVCIYCVVDRGRSYGLLCYAKIQAFQALPESEIERIEFFDELPETLTYPAIQPLLFERVKAWLKAQATPQSSER